MQNPLRQSGWLGLLSSAILLAQASTACATNGLRAQFFGDTRFTSPIVVDRVDPNIDWQWNVGRPDAKVPEDFSVRWTGWIKAPQAGLYNLILEGNANDVFMLALDGKQELNSVNRRTATVTLTGLPQHLVIDFTDPGGNAWITFWWEALFLNPPARSVVPTEVLFPDAAAFKPKAKRVAPPIHGLRAEYFNADFSQKLGEGLAHRLESLWMNWHPVAGMPADGGLRHTGYIVPNKSGEYRLIALADDEIRVWVDNRLVLQGPGDAKVQFQANVAYAIRVDFVDHVLWGYYLVHWIPPGETTETPIPGAQLYPPGHLPKKTKLAVKPR